jgi:hypothetical protein
VLLSRHHAAEVVALTELLGGWGAPPAPAVPAPAIPAPAGNIASGRDSSSSSNNESNSSFGRLGGTGEYLAPPPPLQLRACRPTSARECIPGGKEPTFLSAWGNGGTWSETNNSVFAPEEIFFPTALALLGYLREPKVDVRSSSSSSSSSSAVQGDNYVRIAAVTFAEWARRGDANPVSYSSFDGALLRRMRSSGAVFGRKFVAANPAAAAAAAAAAAGTCGVNGALSLQRWQQALQLLSSSSTAAPAAPVASSAGSVLQQEHASRKRPLINDDAPSQSQPRQRHAPSEKQLQHKLQHQYFTKPPPAFPVVSDPSSSSKTIKTKNTNRSSVNGNAVGTTDCTLVGATRTHTGGTCTCADLEDGECAD